MPKRTTAQEVADRAGTSRTTVSFVLNNVPGMRISEETRQRVLAAAKALNYHPNVMARRMVAQQSRVLGFILNQAPDQAFADHFLPQVLRGVSEAAAQRGYHVLFEPLSPVSALGSYVQLIRERHVDGIILSGPRFDDEALVKIHQEGEHVVCLGQLPSAAIPFVDVDNVGGAKLATSHLVGLGHQRIALITNAPLEYTASADRLQGFRAALAEAGLPFDQNLVRLGSFTSQSGFTAMNELLDQKPLPSAVFVASDTVALGALMAIRGRGLRVPEDIALAGFDDIPLAGFIDPPLTTIHLPAVGLGWGAADLLIRLIEGEEPHTANLLLETDLVVRSSCGASGK